MAVKVRLPYQLRQHTGGQPVVAAEGATVAGIIADLERRYPGIGPKLLSPDGTLKHHVRIFVAGQGASLASAVADGAELAVVLAVGGG